jgi:hypothetical protein
VDKSKFDDWSDVKDCNDCQHYWNAMCDGTPLGSEKSCKSFLATRKVNMQGDLESLRKRLNTLNVVLILYGLAFVIHLISKLLGG